jgi:ribosome-associated translation inhibitor RaiA
MTTYMFSGFDPDYDYEEFVRDSIARFSGKVPSDGDVRLTVSSNEGGYLATLHVISRRLNVKVTEGARSAYEALDGAIGKAYEQIYEWRGRRNFLI